LVGGVAATWPLAKQSATPVVGLTNVCSGMQLGLEDRSHPCRLG
jgi:hypothetical protein